MARGRLEAGRLLHDVGRWFSGNGSPICSKLRTGETHMTAAPISPLTRFSTVEG